jgi:hypothetical protein
MNTLETVSTDILGTRLATPCWNWPPGEEFNPSPANTMNWYPAILDVMLELTE